MVLSLSDEEQHALSIYLNTKKHLKSIIGKRDDIDDFLMILLEIIGIYLLEPDDDRKKESKVKKRKRKEKYESTRETYLRVIKDPLLSNYFDAN